MLKTDYSKVGGLIDQGEYEVIITGAYIDQSKKTGKDYFAIPMKVRNDVDQKFKNFTIWDGSIYALHSDAAVAFKFNNISKAIQIPKGEEFENLEKWGEEIIAKALRVTIKHEEYNGNTQARIQYYNPTKCPDIKHVEDDNIYLIQSTSDEINIDDCPF